MRRRKPAVVLLKCGMCFRRFANDRTRGGRTPQYCPGCQERRRVENTRLRMARLRERRRSLPFCRHRLGLLLK